MRMWEEKTKEAGEKKVMTRCELLYLGKCRFIKHVLFK
jgi:hypothetical protein